jgi:hypothetical protein
MVFEENDWVGWVLSEFYFYTFFCTQKIAKFLPDDSLIPISSFVNIDWDIIDDETVVEDELRDLIVKVLKKSKCIYTKL